MNHDLHPAVAMCIIPAALLLHAGVLTASELPAKAPDIGHMMPLYEVAMIERICSSPRYRKKINRSRKQCAREMAKVVSRCTADHQARFPRASNKKGGGRLGYRSFATGYERCLKHRHAALAMLGRKRATR